MDLGRKFGRTSKRPVSEDEEAEDGEETPN